MDYCQKLLLLATSSQIILLLVTQYVSKGLDLRYSASHFGIFWFYCRIVHIYFFVDLCMIFGYGKRRVLSTRVF